MEVTNPSSESEIPEKNWIFCLKIHVPQRNPRNDVDIPHESLEIKCDEPLVRD